MTDNIGTKLIEAIGTIVPTYLNEAETEQYPYAVFEKTATSLVDKDGIYGYDADVTIHVCSNSFSEADTARSSIINAINSGLNSNGYIARLVQENSDCIDGIWTIDISYKIKQL